MVLFREIKGKREIERGEKAKWSVQLIACATF